MELRCKQHPERAAAFQCRVCGKSFCEGCRDLQDESICPRCGMTSAIAETAEEKLDIQGTDLAARKSGGARKAMIVLALLNVAAGVLWLLISRAPTTPATEQTFDDLEALSTAVEGNRDADGRVPGDLRGLSVPAPLAGRIQAGEIRYYPSPDGMDFIVEASPEEANLPVEDPYLAEDPYLEDESDPSETN